MPVFDEEKNAVSAPMRAGRDQQSVLHRRAERARSCSWAKVHRRASASTVSGDQGRRNLSPEFLCAWEVLREEGQNDSLLLGGEMAFAG